MSKYNQQSQIMSSKLIKGKMRLF